jgi:DNA-binding response OmpR family regulator
MKPLKRSRVLVADHDRTFLDQLTDRLLQMNLDVDFAENGGTAIRLVQTEVYDLIVLDIAMPIFNGLDILRRAKEAHPDVPVLIIAFKLTKDWAEQALREGAYAYLLRPFDDFKQFDHAIRQGLQKNVKGPLLAPDLAVPQTEKAKEAVSVLFEKMASQMREPALPLPEQEPMQSKRVQLLDSEEPVEAFFKAKAARKEGRQERLKESTPILPDGVIEVNSRGQILSCNPAARKWLMLEASTPERPIKQFLQAFSKKAPPPRTVVRIQNQPVFLLVKTLTRDDGGRKSILLIRDVRKKIARRPGEAHKEVGKAAAKGRRSGVFPEIDKRLPEYSEDDGFSLVVVVDELMATIRGVVKRLREANLLEWVDHMLDPYQEEDTDPEVMMTMSRRLSDISGRRKSLY